MTEEEIRRKKARSLRYKRPIAKEMNLCFIEMQVEDMMETIDNVQWFVDDEENLVNALCGDEDEAYEFKAAFADLAAELQQFQTDLHDEYVPDCFDELFPAAGVDTFGGYLGFDEWEGDYFGIQPNLYETAEDEARKRICRLTKKELLMAVGACTRVFQAYMALQYRYDCLEASLKIIQEKNLEGLKLVKAIDEQYAKAEADSHHFRIRWSGECDKYEEMLDQLPQEYWL